MKRQVPLLICGIAGAFMAIQYFIPALLPYYDRVNDYMQIVRAFAIILGLASVIQRHTGRVRRSFSSTRKPLRLGIIMSRMTRSGSSRSARAKP